MNDSDTERERERGERGRCEPQYIICMQVMGQSRIISICMQVSSLTPHTRQSDLFFLYSGNRKEITTLDHQH